MSGNAASEWGNCRVCGEPLSFEGGNVESGVEWGEAKCPNGHIWPAGRKDGPSAAKRRKCLVCGRIIPVRKDGGLRRHSPVWKNPPPGAPVCGGSGV